MSAWWTVLPTFCAARSRCGPPKIQPGQPELCTRCAAPCRCGPTKSQSEQTELCTPVPLWTAQNTAGTIEAAYRRDPARVHHRIVAEHRNESPDRTEGTGRQRSWACYRTTRIHLSLDHWISGIPFRSAPVSKKTSRGFTRSLSDGADQTDRCKLCAARSRSRLLRSAKKQSEQSLLVYIFVPVRTAELCCSVPLCPAKDRG